LFEVWHVLHVTFRSDTRTDCVLDIETLVSMIGHACIRDRKFFSNPSNFHIPEGFGDFSSTRMGGKMVQVVTFRENSNF